MAFRSPPARRSKARQGQPRKARAPIMAKLPRMKRSNGEDPLRALNSRKSRAAANAPSTKPMISGRRYCTTAARCRPSAPAMSRSKQATQMPILGGLPSFCSKGARMPMAAPAVMIPAREAEKCFLNSVICEVSCDGCVLKYKAACASRRTWRVYLYTASIRLHLIFLFQGTEVNAEACKH